MSRPVTNYFELADIIHQAPGKLLQLTYKRGGRTLFCQLTPVDENGVGLIGFNVKIATTKIRYSVGAAMKNSFQEAGRLTFLTFNAFKKIIQRKISVKSFSGPIEIARVSQQALASGFSNFFMLIAFISLQLGIVNLFPIPGLDGGHLLIFTIEAIIRRDLNQKLKTVLIYIGFSFLISPDGLRHPERYRQDPAQRLEKHFAVFELNRKHVARFRSNAIMHK